MKMLPLSDPIVSVYSNIANVQGIILNYNAGKIWTAQSFINYVVFWDNKLNDIKPHFLSVSDIYLGGNYQMFSQNIFSPCLRSYSLPINLIQDLHGIITLIKKAIEKGYYVCLFINRKYIKEAKLEQDEMHETFIYGYDNQKQIVYFCEYFQGESYTKYTCTYQEIEQAFIHCSNYYIAEGKKILIHSIMLIKYEQDKHLNLDVNFIKRTLSNYLNATNIGGEIHFLHTSFDIESECHWGISGYDAFIKYLNVYCQGCKRIPFSMIHHFHHFSDHKKSLRFLTKILYEHGVISEEYENEFGKLVKKALLIRDNIMKYRIRRRKIDKETIEEFINILKEMKDSEIVLINKLLELL